MKSKVIVVAINIPGHDEPSKFGALEPENKLDLICQEVLRNYKLLLAKNPEAVILFCWREYGIASSSGHHVNDDFKKALKKQLSELTRQHPQMVIIAGTLPVLKKVDSKKLTTIETYYEKLKSLSELESKIFNKTQFGQHYSDFHTAKFLTDSDDQANTTDKLYGLKNVCYVFYHGKSIPHGKALPHDELTYCNAKNITLFYQPPKPDASSTAYTIDHPVTKEKMKFCVEICREHVLGLAKHSKVKAHLHVVISAWSNLHLENAVADNLFHIDSKHKSSYVALNEKNPNIKFYVSNLFQSYQRFYGPVEPMVASKYEVEQEMQEKVYQVTQDSRAIVG